MPTTDFWEIEDNPNAPEGRGNPSPELLKEFEAQDRRERRANAVVSAKAKKIHADMLRLERFALAHNVIFATFHEQLLASIHYFERFLWDYDPKYLTEFTGNPLAADDEAAELDDTSRSTKHDSKE